MSTNEDEAAESQRRLDFIFGKGEYGRAARDLDPDKVSKWYSAPKKPGVATISSFDGPYSFLSTFFKARVLLRGEAEPFASVEHAMQASKTCEGPVRARLRECKSALEAKRIAKQELGAASEPWKLQSGEILLQLTWDKYVRHAELRSKLVATAPKALVHWNPHGDKALGVVGPSLKEATGDNKLGKASELVRVALEHWQTSGDNLEATREWLKALVPLVPAAVQRMEVRCTRDGQVLAEETRGLGAEDLGDNLAIIRVGKMPDSTIMQAHPTVSRRQAFVAVTTRQGSQGLLPTPSLPGATLPASEEDDHNDDNGDGHNHDERNGDDGSDELVALVVDLGSSNGTFVNGVRLEPFMPHALSPLASVRFGASSKRYTFDVHQIARSAEERTAQDEHAKRAERYARLADGVKEDEGAEGAPRDARRSQAPQRGRTYDDDKYGPKLGLNRGPPARERDRSRSRDGHR
mmetsp:Transcript_12655/g.46738  ORF Transcript_12655/g.46738 Transcript_12655/m.46738 type:complete len:465 (+) Transcript_12655:56-1450(+)